MEWKMVLCIVFLLMCVIYRILENNFDILVFGGIWCDIWGSESINYIYMFKEFLWYGWYRYIVFLFWEGW